MIDSWVDERQFKPSDEEWPINPGREIVPQIYYLLFRSIIRGELPPGTWITESRIARRCRVSRQPVREAILRLADFGLVNTYPQRGSFVSRICPLSVLSARFAREAIEADIVAKIACEATTKQTGVLRSELSLQRSAKDIQHFIRLDHRFHYLLVQSSGVSRIWTLVRELKARTDRVLFVQPSLTDPAAIVEQHALIVERIAEHDVSGAADAMRTRLRDMIGILPKAMGAYPKHFAATSQPIDFALMQAPGQSHWECDAFPALRDP